MAKLKKIEVTQWFKYEDVPVRYGVYEVNPHWELSAEDRKKMMEITGDGEFFSYWDGKRWGWITISVEGAYISRFHETGHDVGDLPWRGIAGT